MSKKSSFQLVVNGFAILFLATAVASIASASTKVLYSFTAGSDGADPAGTLVFDSAGNAYGTGVVGGDFGYGVVFQLTPHANGKWTQSVLWSFSAGADGKNPYGGVILDAAGNLYGTTVAGGLGGECTGDGCGVVYRLSQSKGGWNLTTLYNFTGLNDGFGPGGAVIMDKDGNLYGTTPDGGKFGEGVIYELSPTNKGEWSLKVLHAFSGGKDGGVGSLGPLTFDSAGNIFGVTEVGGIHGAGTAFRLTSSAGKWRFSTIYAFKGMPSAAYPYGGLTPDKSGNLYGTTYYGGKNGVGSVFQLSQGASGRWNAKILRSFGSGKELNSTTTTLVFDGSGDLWGTTAAGGDPGCDCGGVFELTPGGNKWSETVVHRFKSVPDGAYSYYGLALDSAGNLYGTTVQGGIYNQGAIFRVKP